MKILVLPPKTKALTSSQKGILTRNGVIVIESHDPEKVRLLTGESDFDGSDWFMAALNALRASHPTDKQEIFVESLYKRLLSKEQEDKRGVTRDDAQGEGDDNIKINT